MNKKSRERSTYSGKFRGQPARLPVSAVLCFFFFSGTIFGTSPAGGMTPREDDVPEITDTVPAAGALPGNVILKGESLIPDSKKYLKDDPCEIAADEKDLRTGKRKKELAYEKLLSHTPEDVKYYLSGRDLLQIDGRISRLDGGYIYLTLKFTWSANSPESYFGPMKKNSAVSFALESGKQVTLYAGSGADWHALPDGNLKEMTVHFPIHFRQVRKFKKFFVKKMRVFWSTGYQEFSVYNVGMIKDQLDCIR